MKLKLFALCALAALSNPHAHSKQVAYNLSSKQLKTIDSIGAFNAEIFKIWQTYIQAIKLVTGKKVWSGAIVHLDHNATDTISVHVDNPELLLSASFLVISPDHPEALHFAIASKRQEVEDFIASRQNMEIQERQNSTSMENIFTGSYITNPITKQEIPVYISDYAMCCYDFRHGNARLGIPAHNVLDFTFAKQNNLDMPLAYSIPSDIAQAHGADMPQLAANRQVKAPYIKSYRHCVMEKGSFLEGMTLQQAQQHMVAYLEMHNLGSECEELIQYNYDGEQHSIRSLARIEQYLEENKETLGAVYDKKISTIQNLLAYAHEDFFEIVQPFFSNITPSSQSLIHELVAESMKLHNHENSILLTWAQGKEFNFRNLIKQDLTSFTKLTQLCRELVDFIADFKESCPQAKSVLYSAQKSAMNKKK